NRRNSRLTIRGELAVTSNSPEMSFICSRCVRRDKQSTETAVYLFAVCLPRQATRRKSRLSVRGEFAVTSKSPEKPFIYSRCARRDNQIRGNVVYLFEIGRASCRERGNGSIG